MPPVKIPLAEANELVEVLNLAAPGRGMGSNGMWEVADLGDTQGGEVVADTTKEVGAIQRGRYLRKVSRVFGAFAFDATDPLKVLPTPLVTWVDFPPTKQYEVLKDPTVNTTTKNIVDAVRHRFAVNSFNHTVVELDEDWFDDPLQGP